jgi:hypothetical protein
MNILDKKDPVRSDLVNQSGNEIAVAQMESHEIDVVRIETYELGGSPLLGSSMLGSSMLGSHKTGGVAHKRSAILSRFEAESVHYF